MSLARIACPQCGAGLKSAAGFTPGQKVRCPKCQTTFAVEEPAFEEVDEPDPVPARKPARAAAVPDDDEDDRPRRRRDRDDDEDDEDDRPRRKGKKASGGYATSPLRFVILGVLLVTLGVLGFLLYQKKQREKEAANRPAPANTDEDEVGRPIRPGGPRENEAQPKAPAAESRATNDLKQVMIALHNYHDTKRTFPPAAICDPSGKPLLSWRVAILPYIEHGALYQQFKLDEPWDSPHNQALIPQMPTTYKGTLLTGGEGQTCFKVFVGGGAAFDLAKGKRLTQLTDGTANTIGVVEAGPPVTWTKPDDLPYDPKKPLPDLTPPGGGDMILVGMCDGSVRRVSRGQVGEASWRAGITASGGEVGGLRD